VRWSQVSASDHLLSQGQVSGTSCLLSVTIVTVQSRIQETAKKLNFVWMTIVALVRLNWHLRNVLTYLFTY